MSDKEQSASETVVPRTDCPHGRTTFSNGVWKCTRCNEPVNIRPTRTFTKY